MVRTAQQKGYTEPDPRDDLSGAGCIRTGQTRSISTHLASAAGMDVARKIVLLAREVQHTLQQPVSKTGELGHGD